MKKKLRFVFVPKVSHPWFEEVHVGARTQAEILSRETGMELVIEFLPPSFAAPEEQNALLEKVLASQPQGIALDPVDSIAEMEVVTKIKSRGVPLVLFDSLAYDQSITSVGTNFAHQGLIAAERLLKLIAHKGKVAIMQGYPSAPNHKQRYEAQVGLLRKYPEISIVDGGVDNDDIETAYQQAAAVIAANPDLKGYLCCDASGPIGIARAIKAAGKKGEITVVAMDGIRPILEAIKEGIIDSSAASIPQMQGSISVLMLWQASLGLPTPPTIDTGVILITQQHIDQYLAATD